MGASAAPGLARGGAASYQVIARTRRPTATAAVLIGNGATKGRLIRLDRRRINCWAKRLAPKASRAGAPLKGLPTGSARVTGARQRAAGSRAPTPLKGMADPGALILEARGAKITPRRLVVSERPVRGVTACARTGIRSPSGLFGTARTRRPCRGPRRSDNGLETGRGAALASTPRGRVISRSRTN